MGDRNPFAPASVIHQTWLGKPQTKWRFLDGQIIELNEDFHAMKATFLESGE